MNLFTEYRKEEIEYLLSLSDKKDNFKIPLFKGLLKNEIESICRYIKLENLPKKKIIENYDYIWIIKGNLMEFENKKIIKKYTQNEFIGIYEKILKKNNKSLVTLSDAKLLMFDIKDIHNEFNSIFYKNLTIYMASKFSERD